MLYNNVLGAEALIAVSRGIVRRLKKISLK